MIPPLLLLLRVNALQGWRRLLAVRRQSRLLSSLIGLFVVGYLLISFWLFRRGITFAIGHFPGVGALLVERLMFLLFAFLFVLLLFSNLVISYTNLFKNKETSYLFTLPFTPQTIFQWKFIESALLASWAFLFLIAPLLAAYGLTYRVPWHFYAATVGLVSLFIVLPAVLGSWCAMQLARHMDRKTFQILAVLGAVGLLIAGRFWLKAEAVTDEMLETRVLTVLDRLMTKTAFAQFPLLPSYWLSSGVLQWAEGALASAAFFGLVLLSYALFFGYLAATRMGGQFYEAASAVQSRGSLFARWDWFRRWEERRRTFHYPTGPVERLVRLVPGVSGDVRALLAKDIRVFWRDTTQWGQTLVLFGLLGAYVMNLRHFTQQLHNPFWIHLVSYLNLAACALNLATLTTRFVYPQFSLEGKRVWIVGMAPLGLQRVVKAKFGLAAGGSLLVTLTLVVGSCTMLKLQAGRVLYFAAAITVMTLTLNGLAVGLGVLYPNFKEDNPSKIVSGFGGTFCLVLSFLYIVGSVVLLALASPWGSFRIPSLQLIFSALAGFATLSTLLGWMPLKMALRRVREFEAP
jgi:ABC-2 type transport system permease protein